jgi:hypothetical protein
MNLQPPPIEELIRGLYAAFAARDLDSYREYFTADLQYHDPRGRTIGRDRLMRDVASQFQRISAAATTSFVEEVRPASDTFAVTHTQRAWIALRVVPCVHRLFYLERRGQAAWRFDGARWQICEVNVLEEKMQSRGWQFRRTPQLPPLLAPGDVSMQMTAN